MKLYYFQGVDKLIEYPEGIISMRACKVKPFPTCETCDKWCKHECPSYTKDDIMRKPPKDFFCASHSDFTK